MGLVSSHHGGTTRSCLCHYRYSSPHALRLRRSHSVSLPFADDPLLIGSRYAPSAATIYIRGPVR